MLGQVDRLLDLLIRGAVEPRHLGVEERAVVAARLGVHRQHQQLLVLVGDERLPHLPALEELPLLIDHVVRNAVEEAGHETEIILDLLLDFIAIA